MPKGYRTEDGDDLTLKEFNVTESMYRTFPPRTRDNVRNADVTIWFGNVGSPGYWCTRNAATDYRKLFVTNPTDKEFIALAEIYEIFNIAGNRKSKNPKVVQLVQDAFDAIRGTNE